MSLQLLLFEEVKNEIGECRECIHCIPHDWYDERYKYCKARPSNTMLKIPYIVIKGSDNGCGLFNYKSND